MRREFIFSYTRLQARHGMRPDERTWRLIESQKELANYLQSARQSHLRNWVVGLQATDSHHLIESSLLKLYRDYSYDLALWVPPAWRKSVEWTASLPSLPALQHLISGNTVLDWMVQDAVLKEFAVTNLEQRSNSFLQSEYAPLLSAWQAGDSLLLKWIECWRAMWPDKHPNQRAALQKLISLLLKHIEIFSQSNPTTAWKQREQLSQKLAMLFRKHSFESVAMFIHLLLIALDVERLRGGVVQRCLFPHYREEVA